MKSKLDREDIESLEEMFDIDYETKLKEKDIKYLQDKIIPYFWDLISDYGIEGEVQIKESILDNLLKNNKEDIISYLSLDIDEEIEEELESRLNNKNFTEIDSTEDDKDFFKYYLNDETLNDLVYSWKGYIKKVDGATEKFVKVRKSITSTELIDAIANLIINNFNKINFVSRKEDSEQAEIIIFTLQQIDELINETPYEVCNTKATLTLMSSSATKLMNLIGYSEGNRAELFSALSDSYKSLRNEREGKSGSSIDD